MLVWDAHFLLHFCAIHVISSASFWVGPLWFSALQLLKLVYYDIVPLYCMIYHLQESIGCSKRSNSS